jgi:acyl carrier protein
MATKTLEHPATTTTTFPKADVEAKLRELLVEAVTSDAGLKGITLPPDVPGKSAAAIHLDSLGVVDLLCGVEGVAGSELNDSLVKAGGYRSVNDAVEHLMPRIEKAWLKNGSGGKK